MRTKLRPYVIDMLPDGLLKRLRSLQGRRRTRLLYPADLARVVDEAAEAGWAMADGGDVANSYRWRSISTVCLAVRLPDGMVAIDVAAGDGKRPSPGTAWSELKPFDPSKKRAHMRKLEIWATAPERLIADPLLIRP
jgi:hypothetical protein